MVGTHPVFDANAVAAVVARARTAADTWQALGFAGRRTRLDRWRAELGSRASELHDRAHLGRGLRGSAGGDRNIRIQRR